MKQNAQQVRPRLPALVMAGMAGGAAERMNAHGTGMKPSGEADLEAIGSAIAKGGSKR